MTALATAQHMPDASIPAAATAEDAQWLPPRRMWRYQLAKVVVGAIIGAIFAGWLAIQWSNPMMRFLLGLFVLLTAWITARSVLVDARRSRFRQVSIEAGKMYVTSPPAPGSVQVIDLNDVAFTQWMDLPEAAAGLWFYDQDKKPLGHLDRGFLADEAEARTFLGWARKLSGMPLMTKWNPT